MDTCFAPPERSSEKELEIERELLINEKVTLSFLDMVPLFLFVLNSNRQIVFANKEFNQLAKTLGNEEIIGCRPGEALNCINSDKEEAGCGTSESCSVWVQ